MNPSHKTKAALTNSFILAGLAFFTSLAGIGAAGLLKDWLPGLAAALIAAGFSFFSRLAIEYGLSTNSTSTKPSEPAVHTQMPAEIMITDTEWRVLNKAKDAFPNVTSTAEISTKTKLDSKLVLEVCHTLAVKGLLEITADHYDIALVRITGRGLEFLRNP